MKKQEIIKKLQALTNVQFVGISNYENSNGEISNQVFNLGASLENANKHDIEVLLNLKKTDLNKIAKVEKLPIEDVEKAKFELVESYAKKILGIKNTRSQAQKDAYINLGKGLRLKENDLGGFDLYINGLQVQKTVLVKGNYPTVNSAPKTLAKRAIEKTFNLKAAKFRNFKISGVELLKIAGETIEGEKAYTISK